MAKERTLNHLPKEKIMSEFILFREDAAIGPTFNEATANLKDRKDLTVKHEAQRRNGGMFVIETNIQTAHMLETTLPGWKVKLAPQ